MQVSLIILVFWVQVGFRPITVNTGIYFIRSQMRFTLLPNDTIMYAAIEDKSVLISPAKLAWMIALSIVSAVYLATVLRYQKQKKATGKCGIAKRDAIGVGTGILGSVLSTYLSVFVGCCGTPTVVLLLPLLGGVFVTILGTLLSIISFVALLVASVYVASKMNN